MLRRIVGKECTNPDCVKKGELVPSGEMCDQCLFPLETVKTFNRWTIAALGLVAIAGGAAALYFSRTKPPCCVPPPPPVCCVPPPEPREITFSFTLEVPGEHESVSLAAPDRVFHSGDRFRMVLKPDFNAYTYLFNQNPDEARVHVLYPVASKTTVLQPGEETRAPGGEGWFRMDRKPGSEVLILVASPHPLPELKWADGTLDRHVFESWLAKTEQDAKPKSQRIYQNATWSNLMADATQTPLVFVHRVPLKHE
jgi:hypothetical protein